jgi:arylamine N-acetyltransferase
MANIVTIEDQKYLVDVGFGAPTPSHPLPLISGHICTGIAPQSLRLEYKRLKNHTDPSQRAWVYSYRENDDAKWTEAYSFVEIEFFPEDYEVMNLSTMTLPQSFFTQTVVCVKIILNEESKEIDGVLILMHNVIKTRIKGVTEVVEKLESEEDRIKALEKWFSIVLTEAEKKGIIGLASQLKG